MKIIDDICSVIIIFFLVLNCYDILYIIIGFFCKAKTFPATGERRRYAVVIAARNEEAVIGNLLDSIWEQTYDQSLLTVFVVADNCTDNTARVCREHGAVVFERRDPLRARKGYALEFLFSNIDDVYGIEYFDGFFVFDADNLLSPTFIEEMNKAFVSGADIVTSYRNTKNFDTNFISCTYGIHFMHNTLTRHRPRSLLNMGTHLTGTGYLIRSSLLKDGWHYTNLTEDDELTMITETKGVTVEYCEAAEFYDEQPCDMGTALRQRARWARGRLVAFARNGGKAFSAIFTRRKFTNYDLFFHYFPYGLLTWILGIIYPLSCVACDLFTPASHDYSAMAVNILGALALMYLRALFANILVVIRERRHINCPSGKIMFYVLLSPWFTMVTVYIYLIAIFKDIKWTPIIHTDSRKIQDMTSRSGIAASPKPLGRIRAKSSQI